MMQHQLHTPQSSSFQTGNNNLVMWFDHDNTVKTVESLYLQKTGWFPDNCQLCCSVRALLNTVLTVYACRQALQTSIADKYCTQCKYVYW